MGSEKGDRVSTIPVPRSAPLSCRPMAQSGSVDLRPADSSGAREHQDNRNLPRVSYVRGAADRQIRGAQGGTKRGTHQLKWHAKSPIKRLKYLSNIEAVMDPVQRISKPPPSATRPRLRSGKSVSIGDFCVNPQKGKSGRTKQECPGGSV